MIVHEELFHKQAKVSFLNGFTVEFCSIYFVLFIYLFLLCTLMDATVAFILDITSAGHFSEHFLMI